MSFFASDAQVRIKASPFLKLRELIEWTKVAKEMGAWADQDTGQQGMIL